MLDHLAPFRRRSVAIALYRMLTGRRYDVSVVRSALDVAGVHPPSAALEAVRLHHTEPYADMPPGFRADLAAQTLALFHDRPLPPTGALLALADAAGIDRPPTDGLPALARP